ncbi:phosphotransferase family protein [Sphingobium sp. CAP-1]|uniref:phosphotransferase family protein n=1 Tax=Sphingobium sp. CAP-1 TaxID=2676077 RepID=UPI0012BB3112|nr:aminoglycoside phosphotransferase family protein [Sphingobium sp. CAP-1]QGP77588.1 phosphotransferase [Sphingobium sp. CAP-1]
MGKARALAGQAGRIGVTRTMKHLAAPPMCAHQRAMDGFLPQDHWTRIGQGASADVWAVDDRQVVKLFRADVNDVPIALEYAAGQWAAAQGIPVARPIGRVILGERSGILFERIDGPDMLSMILKRPFRMWRLIRRLARLQARIHRCPAAEALPRQIDVLRHRVARSLAGEAAIAAAERLLDSAPPGNRLVHGDLHPANLLLAPRGTIIIDWAQAASGVPAADVARTELLLRFGTVGGGQVSALAGAITARWYRHCYVHYSGLDSAALDSWRLPIAVAWHRGQVGQAEARLVKWIARLTARSPRHCAQ